MASKPVPLPLTGFTRLGSSVYIYQPPSTSISPIKPPIQPPDLIFFCSWLEAAPKHIAKYMSGYRRLYPTATILLVTTALTDSTIATHSSNARRIAPALGILSALPPASKVLLHLFSNGGAFTACLLARAYHRNSPGGKALPISALILDSSPGKPEYFRTHTALAMSFPRKPRVLYYVLALALHVFLVAYRLVKIVTWQEDLITELRRDLNDGRYVSVSVPRLYVYSDADAMVGWRDVEEHAEEAERKGCKVRREFWLGSGHCEHLMKDNERYWRVVSTLWEARGREV